MDLSVNLICEKPNLYLLGNFFLVVELQVRLQLDNGFLCESLIARVVPLFYPVRQLISQNDDK